MNNYRETSIGTDPTKIPIIETLDFAPKTNNSKDKKNDTVKKIIFIVVVVALMIGVACGVYFYLNLGQKNKKTSNFSLHEVSIIQGQPLSNDLKDYGNFEGVDTSLCSLDFSSVDINVAGSYSYSVKCFKTTKQSIIKVEEFNNFKATTRLLNRKIGATITERSFTTASGDYKYLFVNNINDITSSPGFHVVPIDIKDSQESTQRVYSYLNVLEDDPLFNLECKLNNEVERFTINYSNNRIGGMFKIYEVKYDNEEELVNNIMKINNGIITIDNHNGYAVVEYNNLTIRIINYIKADDIGDSIPISYSDIRTHYESKDYVCINK